MIVPTNIQTMMMNQILSWLMIRLTMTTAEGRLPSCPKCPMLRSKWEISSKEQGGDLAPSGGQEAMIVKWSELSSGVWAFGEIR